MARGRELTSRAWVKLAARAKAELPWVCCRCGGPIPRDVHANHRMACTVDHLDPVMAGNPELVPVQRLGLAHRACNSRHGAQLVNAGRRAAPSAGPLVDRGGEPGPSEWDSDAWGQVPDDGTPPRFMTGRHPAAVGSYGPGMVAWVDQHPRMHPRKTAGLLWWQRLVASRALEHDEDGRLVWRNVLLTVSRQVGKSWLLRSLMAWRIAHPELFGETQRVLHVAHAREAANVVWEPAARWAMGLRDDGWHVRWANGQERIDGPDGSRWQIQAANEGAGVGHALSMALVDEAWRIQRSIVDGAIDPTLAEAESPQLWLVSTAGDSASDLFATYRAMALEQLDDPQRTLIVEWSAPKDASADDPRVWRMASPRWTQRRELEVAEKRHKASPLEFRQQWLNQWVDLARRRAEVTPAVPPQVWAAAQTATPPAHPVVAAVEQSYGGGVSAALAGLADDGVPVVSVVPFDTVASAVGWAAAQAPVLLIGKSLAHDPACAQHTYQTRRASSKEAVDQLQVLLRDGQIRHDGSSELTRQVLAARTSKTPEGTRVRSWERLDAVKAAVWAADEARSPTFAPATIY